ncbi:MAG: 8-amino-7-oxononanoate synthase [Planctomycetota bacterium]
MNRAADSASLDSDLHRALRTVESSGSRIRIDGRDLLNFASNDYLGLAHDARVIEAAQHALLTWGTGAGASSLVTGWTSLHQQCAETLADWLGYDTAVIAPSGFAANCAAITAVVGEQDVVVADQRNHASLIDACRATNARVRHYRHGDVDHARALLERAESDQPKRIVTDAVFSMDGTIAPLVELARLAEEFDAMLIVDEAHGTGVIGPEGRGASAAGHIDARVDLHIGTFSKALGAQGGFIAGSQALIDRVINRGRSFIYSTALTPAMVAAALQAVTIIRSEPERNERRAEHVRQIRAALGAQGWTIEGVDEAPMIAVIIGEADHAVRAASTLADHGIHAPAIRPPTVRPGTSRIRLAPMATHSADDVRQVVQAFANVRQDVASE